MYVLYHRGGRQARYGPARTLRALRRGPEQVGDVPFLVSND